MDKREVIWLKFDDLCLTDKDKRDLILNKKLNDRHINYAQRILHKQFPGTEGLGHTLLQKRKPPRKIMNGLHDRGIHWIVASMIGFESNIVKVYDSVYNSVDPDTVKVILNLFELFAETDHIIEIAEVMPKQQGEKECGLFAIAAATSIITNNNFSYQEQQMRGHLLECFQKNALTQFP